MPTAASLARLAALVPGGVEVRLADAFVFPTRELEARLPGPPSPVLVRITAPFARAALLVLDPGLTARALAVTVGGAPPEVRNFAHHPSQLDEAGQRALIALLDPLLAGVGAHVDGFYSDEAELARLFPDANVIALDLVVRAVGVDGWARVFAPDRLRLAAPPALFASSGTALLERRGRLAAARVHLVMQIGRTTLMPRDLATLAVGDVVTFDEFGPRPPFGGPLLLRLGLGAFLCHLDGEGLTVLKGFELGATRMEPDKRSDGRVGDEGAGAEPEGGAAGLAALLGELPVEVVCELGRVTVSGRELLELRPGAVLPVGRPLAGPVDLTVGGRVVARGELVDVEGEVGVRLTEMHG
jgi:flagellar motor switch protein FliM